MLKITLNVENFEALKNGTYETTKANKLKAITSVATVAAGVGVAVLELASHADNKVGKTAKLLKEIVRIFSI